MSFFGPTRSYARWLTTRYLSGAAYPLGSAESCNSEVIPFPTLRNYQSPGRRDPLASPAWYSSLFTLLVNGLERHESFKRRCVRVPLMLLEMKFVLDESARDMPGRWATNTLKQGATRQSLCGRFRSYCGKTRISHPSYPFVYTFIGRLSFVAALAGNVQPSQPKRHSYCLTA